MVEQCPECDSHNVSSPPWSPETKSDGQGYSWTLVYSYECDDCGCTWTEIETTNRKVEIDEHGREYHADD